ncbi:MAG: hypothetical protein V4622_14035 [Bacteroidota bacterium]
MNFIPSNELNKKKWDNLVSQQNGKPFSHSFYFDANSKFWGAYVDENYTKGIAVSFNLILGIKIIYPPIFGKYFEFLGLNKFETEELFKQIKKDFLVGVFNSLEKFKDENSTHRRFQVLEQDYKFNTLANRMLKKAEANEYKITDTSFCKILAIIKNDLLPKIENLEKNTANNLEKLLTNLDSENLLISKGIYSQNQLLGGLLFCKSNHEILYITGVCKEYPRKNGAMYLCMNEVIQQLKVNEVLNFGGSEIESIRRFYLNLGGVDAFYYETSWDNSPFWFKLIRFLSKKIRK